MNGLKFVSLLCTMVAIPFVVAVSEIGRAWGSEFLIPATISSGLIGILGILSALAISEKAEFFEAFEKGTMWITLTALIAAAAMVAEASL